MMPSGWREIILGDVTEIVRGSSPRPKGDPRYYGGAVPRLMVEDITRDGKYVTPKVDFLTDAGAKLSRPMKKGDLVVVCSGTVGVPSLLAVDACIHDGFLGFREIDKSIDKEFLYYLFLSLRNKFESSATHGGIFTNLTTTGVKDLSFTIPPLGEQEKIAKILSTWDEAIEKMESYLGMRRLLLSQQVESIYSQIKKTGKETDLKSVCTQIQDGTHSTPEYTKEGVPFYSVETLVSNNFSDTKYISRKDHEINIKRCRPERDDLLLTRIGSLGVSKLIDWDIDASIYVSLALLKPNRNLVDGGFLYFYFQTKQFNRELLKRSLLNAAPQKINLGEIGNIPIYLPKDKTTQKAAGTYVMGLQTEVDFLKKKIHGLKLQKQGLMQQLLTGKKRVRI